jgi:hypothetical protein
MKCSAILLLIPSLSACAVHIHVHEAPKPAAVVQVEHPAAQDSSLVTGVVYDSEGAGVTARIAAVGSVGGGSSTTWTRTDGRFALPKVHFDQFTLHASTEDGRVAIAGSKPGVSEFQLVLQPGATFVIALDGIDKARCAVFADGLRIEDFTLKNGTPATVIVPPGEHRVRIYEGDNVLQERHFTAKVGATEEIRMRPQS